MDCSNLPFFTAYETRIITTALVAAAVAVASLATAYVARTVKRWLDWSK